MDMSGVWRTFFVKWPADLPRTGVVVTSFGEQVVYVEFLIGEHTILFERLAPDSVGGRKLVIPYGNIQALKITEPVNNEVMVACGFLPAKPKPKPVRAI